MKKRIRLSESQLYNLIREAFEDDQDWRTYMLKGDKTFKQKQQPNRMARDEFRTPQARERYANLADKRMKEGEDLVKIAQDIFNRDVKNPDMPDWEFIPSCYSRGSFEAPRTVYKTGFNGYGSVNDIIGDYEGDFKALEDFINQDCYFDDELNRWVCRGEDGFNYQRNKQFWKKYPLPESIVHNITESVIRKLRRM